MACGRYLLSRGQSLNSHQILSAQGVVTVQQGPVAISKSCSAQWLIPGTWRFVSSLQRNSMGWSSQCKAHVPWLLLPALLGIPALAQACYTAQSRGGSSPPKEGEMCFWKQ